MLAARGTGEQGSKVEAGDTAGHGEVQGPPHAHEQAPGVLERQSWRGVLAAWVHSVGDGDGGGVGVVGVE